MKNKEFVEKARELLRTKTIYCYGAYGHLATQENVERFKKQYPKMNTSLKPVNGAIMYDCSGLIKSIFWGNASTGAPKYYTKKFPDVNADMIINTQCTVVSENFNEITEGEVVWMPGHIGIYAGDNTVIECTPCFAGGVQSTNLLTRGWKKHGRLVQIDYEESSTSGQKELLEKIDTLEARIEALESVVYSNL